MNYLRNRLPFCILVPSEAARQRAGGERALDLRDENVTERVAEVAATEEPIHRDIFGRAG